ncbi:hypothetical protein [Persicitalea jodogahamensis]|uniref:Phosphopeptide-binding protein n=1 Tax=Persicitalea jodogahamensis TaxID=402147 RepID=A0A8J3D2S4_9BACT|nr:hypothetical protein [Persicitalea jodogahamensis]GHB60403.1 hypothetical protein GCM10007390_12660 [Persicitalea jodogahamensis]
MKVKILSTLAIVSIMAVSCQESKQGEGDTTTADSSAITIEKLEGSAQYPGASLALVSPANTTIGTAGETDFAFKVGDYELGTQTDSPVKSMLANSDKGQHIHFILDNDPYSAHYEPDFKKDIPAGTHYMVAFLSRSYHESVKNSNSFVARKLVVGDAGTDDMNVDLEKPTMIYSRPKGEYSGADTENLLLDFFLLNTTLSENGNKVRATINGNEFMITEWAPQVIKGLPKGEVTIKLELLDADGNLIPGGFNEVTRTVTLKE